MAIAPDYSLSWILPFVRQSLLGRSNFSYENFVWGLFQELEKAKVVGVVKTPIDRAHTGQPYLYSDAPWPLRIATAEAFQYLLNNGFIIPQPPHGAPIHLDHVDYMLTGRGANWAQNTDPLPEDTDGYMKLLRKLVPSLDSVIEQYVSEGLSSFERGTYFAAAVMVGAAAEKAVYLLADSILGAFADVARQTALKNRIEDRKLDALFKELDKTIHDARKVLPYPVYDGAVMHLMSLIVAIKVQRNDAVHPMNAKVSADSVRLSFHAFPHALEKLETLRAWFVAHPKSI
jgi:hypothetical protein